MPSFTRGYGTLLKRAQGVTMFLLAGASEERPLFQLQ